MQRNWILQSTRVAGTLIAILVATPSVFGQRPLSVSPQEAAQRAQYEADLQQVVNDKLSYAVSIVAKWEEFARQSGRWNDTSETDLQNALMALDPQTLLAAGKATTYQGMLRVLATGRPEQPLVPGQVAQTPLSDTLGDLGDDLVYTPITPCRIVDTRVAGGSVAGGSVRFFDVDGSNLSSQGGSPTGCGLPFGVPRAAAMTVTVTGPLGPGWFTAWAFGPQPLSSVLNYFAGQTTANTTIVPIVPGTGPDFSLYSFATADAVIDVVGYFAAPAATALDCTTVTSAITPVAVNVWTPVVASCPAGRTATGGGYDTPEGTLGYPGVWLTNHSNGNGWVTWVDNQSGGTRSIQTFVNCCRVPGR
jgi:hypothetical protein